MQKLIHLQYITMLLLMSFSGPNNNSLAYYRQSHWQLVWDISGGMASCRCLMYAPQVIDPVITVVRRQMTSPFQYTNSNTPNTVVRFR